MSEAVTAMRRERARNRRIFRRLLPMARRAYAALLWEVSGMDCLPFDEQLRLTKELTRLWKEQVARERQP